MLEAWNHLVSKYRHIYMFMYKIIIIFMNGEWLFLIDSVEIVVGREYVTGESVGVLY